MTAEELEQRIERAKSLLRLAGQEIYALDAEAKKLGEGWQMEAFYPLLQEIETYISVPDYSSPGYDE